MLPVGVSHNQQSELRAEAQENEPIFLLGMIGIVLESSIFVRKRAGGLLKRNPMLALILSILPFVP